MRSFITGLAFRIASAMTGTGAVHQVGVAGLILAVGQGFAVADMPVTGLVLSLVAVAVAMTDFSKWR